MRAAVLGSGGREHALAWRLAQSPSVDEVRVWPGNGGTILAGWTPDSPPGGDATRAILAMEPDLVVIGPEAPLVEGLADELRGRGLAVFGPGADGARLEGSKAFAKSFLERHRIPTAAAREVGDAAALAAAVAELGDAQGRVVLKADGLAAGKGVLLPETAAEAVAAGERMLSGEDFGGAGRRLLVEEHLEGWEVSLLAVCDGERFALLPPSQDHKRALEGDRGPNTGGMGAYSPVPQLADAELDALGESVFAATLAGLRAEGIDYRGVLYAGLMMTAAGPRVLEFNCRFGDPETQAVLPRVTGDFGALLAGAAAGALDAGLLGLRDEAALTVVLASAGYPAAYATGHPIDGPVGAMGEGGADAPLVFHAGTRLEDGRCVTAGGRVLAVTALGRDMPQAAQRCYDFIDGLRFEGRSFRRDIGWRILSRGGGV